VPPLRGFSRLMMSIITPLLFSTRGGSNFGGQSFFFYLKNAFVRQEHLNAIIFLPENPRLSSLGMNGTRNGASEAGEVEVNPA
jgi:hypothetical protein